MSVIAKVLHDLASPLSILKLGFDWLETDPKEAMPHLLKSVNQMEVWLNAYRQLLIEQKDEVEANKFARFWCANWVCQGGVPQPVLAALMVILPNTKPEHAELVKTTDGAWHLQASVSNVKNIFDNVDSGNPRMALHSYVLERARIQETATPTSYSCLIQPA